jgi:putative ABC transport system permease protein
MKTYPHPPRFARWLLNRMTAYEAHHSIQGDFEETFRKIAEQKGILRARLWYNSQVLRGVPKYLRLLINAGLGLFSNYLKLTLRNLRRYRFYAVINIFGLAIGLASLFLIYLYVRFETSYDKYHPDSGRIYRLVDEGFTAVPYILGNRLKEQTPEMEEIVRLKELTYWGSLILEAEGKQVLEKKLFAADPSLFNIFSFKFIQGSQDSALSHPGALTLTKSTALRYFGSKDPLNKAVVIDGFPFQVTAVIADIPPNTHFHFNAVVSTSAIADLSKGYDDRDTWTSSNYKTYVKLHQKADPLNFESRVNTIYRNEREDSPDLRLQALTDIHLYSHLRSEFEANGDIRYIRFAVGIGLVILMVAVLNFMNLASAHSLHRSREIGMRKVLGAQRSQLVHQFIGEATAFTALASLLAVGLAYSLLPVFSHLTGSKLEISQTPWGMLILFLLAVIVLVGTAAGSYPAFFASGFQPVKALQGAAKAAGSRRFPLRNFLVGFQFIVSIIFVCSSLVIWRQMNYMKKNQLGDNSERIIIIELPRQARHLHQSIKIDLLSHTGVSAATASDFLPSTNSQNIGSTWEGRIESEDIYLAKINVDIDFLSTFGIEVVAGEPFTDKHRPGSTYMVNETAARLIGDGNIKSAVGKVLQMATWTSRPDRIIGVVKDFHFRSLHRDIEPMVFFLDSSRKIPRPRSNRTINHEPFKYVSAAIAPGQLESVVKHIKKLCRHYIPYSADSWFFFDEDFARLYAAEQRIARFMLLLAIIAVSLAGLGLLGLSIYTVESRRKEIGIRRVMGASTSTILILFFKDLFRIHLIAMLFAFPIVYYFMHGWLNNFAYRISLGPWFFAAGAFLTAALFFVTSSANVLKNAAANPADTLRYE